MDVWFEMRGLLHTIAYGYLAIQELSIVITVCNNMNSRFLRLRRLKLLWVIEGEWFREVLRHRRMAMYHIAMSRMCEGQLVDQQIVRSDLTYRDYVSGRYTVPLPQFRSLPRFHLDEDSDN